LMIKELTLGSFWTVILPANEFIGIRLDDILLNNEDEAFGQSVNFIDSGISFVTTLATVLGTATGNSPSNFGPLFAFDRNRSCRSR